MLSMSVAAQTKRVFVVGLGRQQDATWAKISADRDAEPMSTLLRGRHFSDLTTAPRTGRTLLFSGLPSDNQELLRRIRQFSDQHRAVLPQTPTLSGDTGKWPVRQVFENQRGG